MTCNRILTPLPESEPDREARTPRISGSYAIFLAGSAELARLCRQAANVYRSHPLRRSRKSEVRCLTIAELADACAEGFDAWTREPPAVEERGAQIDSFIALRDEARPMLVAVGIDLGKV